MEERLPLESDRPAYTAYSIAGKRKTTAKLGVSGPVNGGQYSLLTGRAPDANFAVVIDTGQHCGQLRVPVHSSDGNLHVRG